MIAEDDAINAPAADEYSEVGSDGSDDYGDDFGDGADPMATPGADEYEEDFFDGTSLRTYQIDEHIVCDHHMGARPQTETTLCSWAADTASELSEPGGYLSVELPDEAVRAAMLPLDLNDLERPK